MKRLEAQRSEEGNLDGAVRNPRAFTLVEVLVSLAVLAVLSLPLISSYQLSAQSTVREAHHLKALFLAHMVKERMRRQNDWAGSQASGMVPLNMPTFVMPRGYTCRVFRRPKEGGLMEARIEIHWKVRKQRLKTFLTLLLSNRAANGIVGSEPGTEGGKKPWE